MFRDEAFLERENILLNYHANAKVYGLSKKPYLQKLEALRVSFFNNLKSTNIVFITLGTAWVYEEKKSKMVVANCHKVKQANFAKKMLNVEDIVEGQLKMIRCLKLIQPELDIVYTVSPVRHIKDGLIENNRSKARLFQAIDELEKQQQVTYFPAYELVIDELRDYCFFEEDGVHPNAKAVKAVNTLFFDHYLSQETLKDKNQFMRYKQQLKHVPIHPELNSAKVARQELEKEFNLFKREKGIG